jgi:hypothetical protein
MKARVVGPGTLSLPSLRLRVPAADAASGRRLAQAVAEELAARSTELAARGAGPIRTRIVTTAAPSGRTLARTIVDRMLTGGNGRGNKG